MQTTQIPQFPFQKLEVYRVAKELARRIHKAQLRDAELKDQAGRASKSAFLCLCEGLPNRGPAMRRRHFVLAHNSLHETVGAIELAKEIDALGTIEADEIRLLCWRFRILLSGLMR